MEFQLYSVMMLVRKMDKTFNGKFLSVHGMGSESSHSGRFLEFLYQSSGKRDLIMKAVNKSLSTQTRVINTKNPAVTGNACMSTGERRCEDGSCIARVELCPEEQLMNQNTILIMIVVGLAVVVFLVILYCFQQRQRRANREYGGDTGLTDDCDNASLYAPPPSYEDVVNSNLYPATPQQRRLRQLSADEEVTSPLTPPPNYDTALIILAQSQDSVFSKPRRNSSLYRRSVSMEHVTTGQNRRSTDDNDNESLSSKFSIKRNKNFFRFSRQCSRASANSSSVCHSPSLVPHSPPPYPQTPPVYPLTPPPPFTPTYPPTSTQSQTQVQIQIYNTQSVSPNRTDSSLEVTS